MDMLCEAPASRFVDEPLLDSRVGRIVLGTGLLARFRLDRYVRRHPGVRVVAALNHYNIGAARLKKHFGGRVHVMLTQRENLSADEEWRSAWKYRAQTREIRKLFNEADAVVTVSQGLADDLRTNFGIRPERLHAIYNPAFRPAYVEAAKAPVDHPWLAHKDQPVVIAAGRLHFVKGFGDLLRAFAQVRAQRSVRLIILGEGKERPNLEALVGELGLQDSVQLPGRVPWTAPWFARADVFVLSSRREGLPAVLIEALSVGLPVVATRCPSGPEEILQDGRLGRLVEVGDVDGLARAIEAALDDPSPDRDALRSRAAEFSLDRALEQYLALWKQPPIA
ncbi:MAG TPA: glycosyltransferase [Nevskiaceae bacterium]|nr:glycosyltransferase [Nevskiaceae bacterium]